jgi:hypothetical protein
MKGDLHLLRAPFEFEQVANLHRPSMACFLRESYPKMLLMSLVRQLFLHRVQVCVASKSDLLHPLRHLSKADTATGPCSSDYGLLLVLWYVQDSDRNGRW